MGRKPHRRLNERQERDHHGDVEVDEEKAIQRTPITNMPTPLPMLRRPYHIDTSHQEHVGNSWGAGERKSVHLPHRRDGPLAINHLFFRAGIKGEDGAARGCFRLRSGPKGG
jgi:hypothetical protein